MLGIASQLWIDFLGSIKQSRVSVGSPEVPLCHRWQLDTAMLVAQQMFISDVIDRQTWFKRI